MNLPEERQVFRTNMRVCKYRHDVRNFLEDLNSKETVTCDLILKLADNNDLMCLFAHGGHGRNDKIYGVLLDLRFSPDVSNLILKYSIEIEDEENIPCFYISGANKTVEKRIGFEENQMLGLLCRANQFKVGNPARFLSRFSRKDLDDEESEAYDLNKKHFANISAEFLNTKKYLHSDGKKNNLDITYFPMSNVDELARGCGQTNSMVFPLLNFDIDGTCYINMNQFFIFEETKGKLGAQTITTYRSFSLAQRLDMAPCMEREESLDILEDCYDPESYTCEDFSSDLKNFIKSFKEKTSTVL